MESQRDELRDHLVAALEAAPELPRDDRAYLADTFLDELDARFELVPRSPHRKGGVKVTGQMLSQMGGRWWLAIAAFAAISLLWTGLWLAGPGWNHAHGPYPPIFPLVLIILVAIRLFRPWRRGHFPR
jgi:hypothetical protein